MDRGTALMQGFRAKLAQRMSFIAKTAYATTANFDPVALPGGEFSITVTWKNKDGTEDSYQHVFTRERVFGQSFRLGTNAWYSERCATDHARDVIRAVLDKRMNRG